MKNKKMLFIGILLIALAVLLSGCVDNGNGDSNSSNGIEPTSIKSFNKMENAQICKEDGKPVVRLFSTTWCPHCIWIKDAFDSTVKEYIAQGKIIAYHWELDTGDNTLTPEAEGSVPASESAIYKQFNPEGTVPTFVFGCKYYRIGNAYEAQKDLSAEIGEFKAVIEELLKK